MTFEKLTAEEALQRGLSLPFALIRSVSSVSLGHTPEQVETDGLLDARFFSDTQEVRLFRRDGQLQGAVLNQDADESYWEKIYKIENPALGREIVVRYELSADEDGQTYLSAARLAGWKGGVPQ